MRFLFPFHLTVTYQVVGIISGFPQHAHGCVLTQRVYFSLTQRRRFGRNIKDSRRLDPLSAPAPFRFIWMMLVVRTEGTRSLSRGDRRHNRLAPVPYGLHFPVRHPP